MSRGGSSSRKLPARTSSTSWHSAGEALCTDTARGRLLSAATATIFVPLPRRVGPTAKPPFWRSRTSHPRTPLPDSAGLAHADVAPASSAPLPASRCESIAGIGGGRSGTADISPATRATALPCPAPRTHRSARPAYRATVGRGCPHVARVAAPAPPRPTVRHSVPSVLSRPFAVSQSSPRIARKRLSGIYETGSRAEPAPVGGQELVREYSQLPT